MLDQTHDLSGQQLYRFEKLYEAPAFVKNADITTLCGESLPPDNYADPVNHLFPCHTPAATWASTAFFLEKKSQLNRKDVPIIETRLKQFATYHQISQAIDKLHEKVAAVNTGDSLTKLSDDDFALVVTTNNSKYRDYPLRNSSEVKKAADYLAKYRDVFPYPVRRDFADRVLQKAAAFGAELGEQHDYITRQAGYGACATKTAVAMLRERVSASQNGPGELSDAQKEMLKLAQLLERKPSKLREPGMRVKLAHVVDDFDRNTKLNRSYGSRLQRPEDVLFELTQEKMAAAAAEHCSTITGNIYKLADIERINIATAREVLGDDFVAAVSNGRFVDSEKAAAIIPTMDRGSAELFDKMMAEIGAMPLAKEASSRQSGLSRSYLMTLAEDHKKARA
jgi:hypothetical protein